VFQESKILTCNIELKKRVNLLSSFLVVRSGKKYNFRVAFSLAEVLIAICIVAFALVPIITMSGSSSKKAAFSEFNIFFQSRAIRVIEHYSVVPYADLKIIAKGSKGIIEVALVDPPIPYEFKRKLKSANEALYFKEIEPGLGKLTAVMQWSFPLDPGSTKKKFPHEFVLEKLVSDRTWSLSRRDGINLGP